MPPWVHQNPGGFRHVRPTAQYVTVTVGVTSSTLGEIMGDDDDELWTVEDAARYLKVSTKIVRREAAAGRLPGRKIGREWRFTRAGLRAWATGDGPTG